ncbi:Lrp/AsnC family transcriptional regulator [Qaidamihabitans albus]
MAKRLGLPQPPCLRRVKCLEDAGHHRPPRGHRD